jgi:hypothetical protein
MGTEKKRGISFVHGAVAIGQGYSVFEATITNGNHGERPYQVWCSAGGALCFACESGRKSAMDIFDCKWEVIGPNHVSVTSSSRRVELRLRVGDAEQFVTELRDSAHHKTRRSLGNPEYATRSRRVVSAKQESERSKIETKSGVAVLVSTAGYRKTAVRILGHCMTTVDECGWTCTFAVVDAAIESASQSSSSRGFGEVLRRTTGRRVAGTPDDLAVAVASNDIASAGRLLGPRDVNTVYFDEKQLPGSLVRVRWRYSATGSSCQSRWFVYRRGIRCWTWQWFGGNDEVTARVPWGEADA